MISPSEADYIKNHAYIPEHITDYVVAISGTEPCLSGDYLCYVGKGHLTFVGYSLKGPFREEEMKAALEASIERFGQARIALIAPVISMPNHTCSRRASDRYYKLDLSDIRPDQKLRNAIRRASRELHVERNREWRDEHKKLVSEFLLSHEVDDGARFIFERIPEYVSSVPTALLFSARDRDERLVAFDIAEFGAKDFAFYMFNFTARRYRAPGASDLLLHEVIAAAEEEGKSHINLGLGINAGVTFFKEKWGGAPFLDYEFCLYERSPRSKSKSLFETIMRPPR